MTDPAGGAEGFTITFPGGRTATAVVAPAGARAEALVEALGLVPAPAVVVVIGGGDSLDPDTAHLVAHLFPRGLVDAASEAGAVVVDGGTASGVMAVVGQAVADHAGDVTLVGVAPAAQVVYPGGPTPGGDGVALDANHSHFVLAPGKDWGDETETLFACAGALLAPGARVVAVVVGGGETTRREVREAVGLRWPVVVIGGTGGTAAELALAAASEKTGRGRRPATADAQVADLVAGGAFDVVDLLADPTVLRRTIRRHLGRDESLDLAWGLYASLDGAATRQQREFRRGQGRALVLAVVATLLAVLEGTFDAHDILGGHWLRDVVLRYAIILLPITLGCLVATAAHFRAGSKWVALRGGAEAVKREVFRYRARSGPYAPGGRMAAQSRLAERVGVISSSVMKTDVNLGAIEIPDAPVLRPAGLAAGDDGFSPLGPESYIEWRLLNQAGWYQRKAVKLERRLRLLRWAGIAFGGLGTFLAAVGLELWIAVTTAVVAAVTTYTEYTQVESTLAHFNQAAQNLQNIRRWWVALSPADQVDLRNVSRLVEQSERTMRSENSGWVEDMHDALAELRREQEEADDEHPARTHRAPGGVAPDTPGPAR